MSAMTSSSSSGSSASDATKIPLTRQRVVALVDHDGTQRRVLQAANATVSSSRSVPLVNYNSVIYFATIQIESSAFTVLVDTGSSDLWVSCAYVASTTCSATCPSKATVIMYGSGNVCIQGAYASVRIGNVAVKNYVVGIAQGQNVLPTSSTNLLPGTSQGLLGLGYQAIAAIPTPGGQFIDYLTSFSIYLTDDAFSDGSFLLLNGVDTALIAKNKLQAYTIPLQERAHWTIGMTAFQIGSGTPVYPCSTSSSSSTSRSKPLTPGCRSIVDTGTSLLSMPTTLFNAFATSHLVPLGCFIPSSTTASTSTGESSSSSATSSVYVCPKTAKLPRLGFTFGNTTFYLDGSDYTLEIARTDYAIVELQPTGNAGSLTNAWIIGDTFLKKYYSSYATNQSVTFYCPSGACKEGAVATSAFPASGTIGSSGGTSGSSTGGNGNDSGGSTSTSDGSSDKLSSTTVILIVAGAVLGLALLIIAAVQLRRWQRARRDRQAGAQADAMRSPAVGAPVGAFYAGSEPLSPIGPRV